MNDLTEPPDALVERLRSTGLRVERGPSLAPGALRLARRKRRRRRIGTTAVCLAALVFAVPVGISMRAGHLPGLPGLIGAGRTAATGPARGGPVSLTSGDVDPARLPAGAAPRLPWYADGTIHDGSTRLRLPVGPNDGVSSLAKTRGGYLAVVVRGVGKKNDPASVIPTNQLILVRPDGTRKTIVSTRDEVTAPFVSADGRHVAWSVRSLRDGSGPRDRLYYAAADGTILRNQPVSGAGWYVDGMTDPTVLVSRDVQPGRAPVSAWHPDTGEIDAVDLGAVGVTATSRYGTAMVLNDAKGCSYRPRAFAPTPQWKVCGLGRTGWFSPGSARLALAYVSVTAPAPLGSKATKPRAIEPSSLTILDANDGGRQLRIVGQAPDQVAWEDADTFVFVADDGSRSAVVRCTVAGVCERATPTMPSGSWYALANQR